MSKRTTVAVLFGGQSPEHEVSVRSARTVLRALHEGGFATVPVGIARDGRWYVLDSENLQRTEALENVVAAGEPAMVCPGERPCVLRGSKTAGALTPAIDVVFPVLHGRYGEDGCVQGLLELWDVPYVGAGVLGSALGMDKEVQKRLLEAHGLPVVPFTVVHRTRRDQQTAAACNWGASVGFPLFVKPACSGSSIGVQKVKRAEDLPAAIRAALELDTKVVVEKAFDVREIECAVLGNAAPEASVLGEIRPRHEFYSYEAKYCDPDGAELLAPAVLPPELTERIRAYACEAFRVLQCSGMARVDFFVVGGAQVFVNEINTIPGFTDISMYPRLWELSGKPLPKLVAHLIELAVQRHQEKVR
jgi:D-alanine-D-alanine ligase